MSERPLTYRGTKFFKYLDPRPLDELHGHFLEHGFLKIKGRDLEGHTEQIEHSVTITQYHPNELMLGRIVFKERKKEPNASEYYWKHNPMDFMMFTEPSALILHGSIVKMNKIVEGFSDAVNPDENPDDGDTPSFFDGYGNDQRINKYVIKKIVKRIEDSGNNILFDPHFKELRESTDARGGEGFYRRDRTSAFLDEKFCYLFELCTYWEPELHVRNSGGITSLTNHSPYNMTITSDFSFKFATGVRKEQLDTFWTSLVIPIITEDNYQTEETECVENARTYSERLGRTQ